MEKYAVDIDKVLDDFEETEALKIENSKNTNTTLLQPSILQNCNEGNEFSVNEVEATFQKTLKSENETNSNERNSLGLNKNILSLQVPNDKCLKYFETPDGCSEKNSSFIENGKHLSEMSHLVKEDCTSNVLSSSILDVNQDNEIQDSCQSVGVHSNHDVKLVKCDFLNNVKPAIERVESHLVIENNLQLIENDHELHLGNTGMGEKQLADTFQELQRINWNSLCSQLESQIKGQETSKVISLSSIDTSAALVDKNLMNEQNSEIEFETDTTNPSSLAVEEETEVVALLKSEGSSVEEEQLGNRNSNVIQERNECNERVFQYYVRDFDDSEEEDSGVSSEEGDSPFFSFDNQMLNSNEDAHAGENKSVDLPTDSDQIYLEACSSVQGMVQNLTSTRNHSTNCDMAENNASSSKVQVVEEIQSSEGFQFQNKFCGARPKLDGVNQFSVTDAYNAETEEEKEIAVFSIDSDKTLEVSMTIQGMVQTITSIKDDHHLTNCDMVENYASSSKAQLIEEMDSSESSTSNKYAGARPKLDNVNSLSVSDTCNEDTETKNEAENQNLKIDNVNSNKLLDQCDEIISEANNCDISKKSSDLSMDTSCNVDSDFSSCATGIEVKCDNEISVNTESFSACAERDSSITSDIKTPPPQRLPRPTTLALPSRSTAVSETSGESSITVTESINLKSDICVDFSPNETSVDDSVSEPSPSVRQQPQIGLVKPFWIPDAEASNCMHCGVKFTVIKRRHHCRACGKVLCSRCCNLRAKLAYLNKEDRICHRCFEILSSSSQIDDIPTSTADSQSSSSCGSSPNFSPSPQIPNARLNDKNSLRPHPNNPDDYCSTIPPLQQIQLSGTKPPPTVMVPIGVLKRDGIRPGGDLTDLTEPADVIPAYRRLGRKRIENAILGDLSSVGPSTPFTASQRSMQKKVLVSDDEGSLPPVVIHIDNDMLNNEKLDWNKLVERMQDDDQKPVNFALLKNMHLFVKLIKLDCCFGKECWCFTSHGLCAIGQDEVMVILERFPGECTFPRGIIKLFTHIYDSASKGSTFEDLGHIIFPEQILGSSDHRGFLFVRPTFQCLSKLIVPNTPFLVAILIHKWEVPWAKVFPLRLMLRLGAECRYYPCALVSVRHRKPVFFEIGQTIMSVLADLRNYQFTIPVISGLVVHMEEKKTCVNIPRNRYDKVMKVINSNNVEHVLALGSNFSSEADSHLVCMQKEEGDYQTQAINIENTTRRVTGASFIVFSGALKSSSGLSAKFSIVEDGLLVQIPQETMVSLHMALRDMKDLTIECGQINATEPDEIVIIQWTRDDKKVNIGVRSPIDCRSLEGIQSLRIHTSTDYAGDNYLIRWTEVFFLDSDESNNSIQHELVDPCRLAETIAQSCCMALAPYLDQLAESELTKIGLRVTLDSERDRVEYDIGSRGKPLPAIYMNSLDCALIPVILRLSGSAQNEPVSFELIFYILIK